MSQPSSGRAALPPRESVRVAKAPGSARIMQAGHERVIVTYSARDDIVCVLTPPGQDPAAVLRAARLVLPAATYEELVSHLGVPADWASE